MNVFALQINPIVGDLVGNKKKILDGLKEAQTGLTDIIATPELAICGYAPCDYLLNEEFVTFCFSKVEEIAREVGKNTWLFVGLPTSNPNSGEKPLYNSCAICNDGKIVKIVNKTLLPTYDVFDEARYFEPCKNPEDNIIHIKGVAFGVTICEDIWNEGFQNDPSIYGDRPVYELWKNRADIIINLSASPFVAGKPLARAKMVQEICTNYNVSLIYVNQVGGNDSLVFDGRSMMVAPQGFIGTMQNFNANVAPAFKESVYKLGTVSYSGGLPTENPRPFDQFFQLDLADVKDALVLGIKDYFGKLGFTKAVIGLSGGVDSAVTAALAAEALGAENVYGVSMPTRFNSDGTKNDAREQAERMGIHFKEVPIEFYLKVNETIVDTFVTFGGDPESDLGIMMQNGQARTRGTILMGLTNAIPGSIVLSTGNKSELSMGYCTIYGDMCGGLNALGDVYKTRVFELAKLYSEWIPESVWTRPPSAELAEDQVDEDSLPPYHILDPMLRVIVDQDGNSTAEQQIEINALLIGWDSDRHFGEFEIGIERAVRMNEYKRQQGAPCIKINPRTLTNGWRRPIVAKIRMY